ncbi:hypothetical protein GCM10022226_61530 [Sphaerisporangium flaviroseum]|uniref:Uncharacterized protein n=1 Tax=Sphaerisporangium flaviroseum TaxID=509199 RepID=A0ABP7J0W0_9ACTN
MPAPGRQPLFARRTHRPDKDSDSTMLIALLRSGRLSAWDRGAALEE